MISDEDAEGRGGSPTEAPRCFQKTKPSPQDFLSLRLWLQSPDSVHTLRVPLPVQGSGLETCSFLEDKDRNRRGNRSVDATPTMGTWLPLVLHPEMNLREGKGLLGPEERFGQTRMEREEELETLVETGCRGANPVWGLCVEGRKRPARPPSPLLSGGHRK